MRGPQWFETAHTRLLTMRVWHCAAYDDLILRSALCARLEGWAADTADMTSYPRGAFRPSFALRFTLFEIRGRGEDRVTAAPGALAPEKLREGRVTTGTADITPAFPAQWFTAYSVLSPVNQHLPPSFSQRLWSFSRQLSACIGAPGPHDFAVRVSAARQSAPSRPPHSASRFVTTAIRPSCRGRMGALYVKSEFR